MFLCKSRVLLLGGWLLLVPQILSAQIVIGHRGASFDAPENTLAAFRLAWDQGADGVEGDFYFTADQQIVCIHDADTKRTGGKRLPVAQSTLSQLRALEYGNWKSPQFAGEPLPTFADVLACIPPGKRFVIELKTGPEIIPLLARQIETLKPDRSALLIIAFDKETVLAAKQTMPDIKAHWLTSFRRSIDGVMHPTAAEIAETLRETQADGLGCKADTSVVTQEFIDGLRQAGMKEFHVWTVDSPDDARYFQRLGAVGITTNKPSVIRSAITRD